MMHGITNIKFKALVSSLHMRLHVTELPVTSGEIWRFNIPDFYLKNSMLVTEKQ